MVHLLTFCCLLLFEALSLFFCFLLKIIIVNVFDAENIDTGIIARGLPGASGADLENMVNMAAIKATNENASLVDMSHIDYARDKIILGK